MASVSVLEEKITAGFQSSSCSMVYSREFFSWASLVTLRPPAASIHHSEMMWGLVRLSTSP